MTKEQWVEKLIKHLASGHTSWPVMEQARNYLAGKEPPEDWEPKAVKEYNERQK